MRDTTLVGAGRMACLVLSLGASGCLWGGTAADPNVADDASGVELFADQTSGRLEFSIRKATGEHVLAAERFEIRLGVDEGVPTRLTAEVDLASLLGGPVGLVEDLAREGLLDIAHFPKSRLRADHFVEGEHGEGTWHAEAELEFKGITRPIGLELELHRIEGGWTGAAQMLLEPAAMGFDDPSVDAEMVSSVAVLAEVRVMDPPAEP